MFLEFLVKRKTYFNLGLFKEMDSFLVSVSRWMLATLLVFGAMQQSGKLNLCDRNMELENVVIF